jgi:hypothetical protein
MSPETENFDQLRRLLALKRHEQPPPGYFHHFSSQVIARIEAGERADDPVGLVRFIWEGVWLQRLWDAIESKPALAGVFGAAVCGFLVAGVIYTDSPTSVRSPFEEKMAGTQTAQVTPGDTVIEAAPPVGLTRFSSQEGVAAVQVHTLLDEVPKPGFAQPVFKLGDSQ